MRKEFLSKQLSARASVVLRDLTVMAACLGIADAVLAK
jgi:hypothetical protein